MMHVRSAKRPARRYFRAGRMGEHGQAGFYLVELETVGIEHRQHVHEPVAGHVHAEALVGGFDTFEQVGREGEALADQQEVGFGEAAPGFAGVPVKYGAQLSLATWPMVM